MAGQKRIRLTKERNDGIRVAYEWGLNQLKVKLGEDAAKKLSPRQVMEYTLLNYHESKIFLTIKTAMEGLHESYRRHSKLSETRVYAENIAQKRTSLNA